MDTIDKWLKSLRLHKYTHLFKSLTYHEMLNLDEKYLIDCNVTKGARNKMLVSIKKLNLRQDRLINMIDDLNQDNISMKEALTVLKDILVTPIPSPLASESILYNNRHNNSNSRSSRLSVSSEDSSSLQSHMSDPYELTYLYIETLDKLAARLIESTCVEDNACHGIMAAILDECMKHNSFTKEQKAKVASYKQHFFKEQRARVASFRQHFTKVQKVKLGNKIHHQIPQAFREYSLLNPAITFELPCLRALVEKNSL